MNVYPKESFCIPNNQFLSYIHSFPPLLTSYGSWLLVLLAGNNPIFPTAVLGRRTLTPYRCSGRNLGNPDHRVRSASTTRESSVPIGFCQLSFSMGCIEVWDDLSSPGSLNIRLPKLVSVCRRLLCPARYFFALLTSTLLQPTYRNRVLARSYAISQRRRF